jgi:hypothetical protein
MGVRIDFDDFTGETGCQIVNEFGMVEMDSSIPTTLRHLSAASPLLLLQLLTVQLLLEPRVLKHHL